MLFKSWILPSLPTQYANLIFADLKLHDCKHSYVSPAFFKEYVFQQLFPTATVGTIIFWSKTNLYICYTHSCSLSVRKYSNFYPGNSRLEWFSQMSTLSNWNVLDETCTMSNDVTFSISFKVSLLLTLWQISLIEISNVLSVALASFSYFC